MSEIMRAASNAIRGVIVPDEGRKLVVSDLSNIEGRTLAWLAGEEWKLQAFRAFDKGEGHDLYVMAYSRSFNVTPDAVIENKKSGDGTWRQIGKVQELALGYQGSTGAFLTMGALYGIDMPEEDALRIVRAWRKAHPNIRAWWHELETAAKDAIRNEGVVIPCRRVSLCRTGAWLRILLPSGRELCYVSPTISGGQKCPDCDGHGHIADERCETCFGRGKLPEQISYMGVCPYTKTWRRIYTYGGKLAENITQAVARDVMADRMPAVAQAGFAIILTVHDELITEAPDTPDYSHERLSRLLSQQPMWALDLPLAAGGFEAYRYRKD